MNEQQGTARQRKEKQAYRDSLLYGRVGRVKGGALITARPKRNTPLMAKIFGGNMAKVMGGRVARGERAGRSGIVENQTNPHRSNRIQRGKICT